VRPLRLLPATISLAAFVAVGFAFTRAFPEWKEYEGLKKTDSSAAEVYLDSAKIWGGAGFAAFVAGAVAARLALRRS